MHALNVILKKIKISVGITKFRLLRKMSGTDVSTDRDLSFGTKGHGFKSLQLALILRGDRSLLF